MENCMLFDKPELFEFNLENGLCKQKEPLCRKLDYMANIFYEKDIIDQKIKSGDNPIIYKFYDMGVPTQSSDLAFGCSICYPGMIGNEYFMTKGHFHNVIDTAETYLCLSGRGILLMENVAGDWEAIEMKSGSLAYVPPGWAHRSVNIGHDNFVTFYNFRGDAGHDYGSIEKKGFRKLIIRENESWVAIDNPEWGGK